MYASAQAWWERLYFPRSNNYVWALHGAALLRKRGRERCCRWQLQVTARGAGTAAVSECMHTHLPSGTLAQASSMTC